MIKWFLQDKTEKFGTITQLEHKTERKAVAEMEMVDVPPPLNHNKLLGFFKIFLHLLMYEVEHYFI